MSTNYLSVTGTGLVSCRRDGVADTSSLHRRADTATETSLVYWLRYHYGRAHSGCSKQEAWAGRLFADLASQQRGFTLPVM